MPKQYLRLSDFSGGLNTRFDARDINDNELTLANNVQVYKTGQIFTSTSTASVHADLDRSAGTTTSGYGLFLFKADNDISNNAKSIELLALADSDGDAQVDIIEDPFDTISARDVTNHQGDGGGGTAPIDLGSTTGGKFIYYYVDGALRIADANGGANNTVTWYGHVDRTGSANTVPGGNLDTWVETNNNLAAPGGTNCNITNTGSAAYGQAGQGFDVDLTVETTDDDGLWEATTYEFAQSFVYEGEQESLLDLYSESVTLSTNNYFTNVLLGLDHQIDGTDLSDRIKGGRVYIRKKDSTDLWTLFLDVNFERGVRKDMGDTFVGFTNGGSGTNFVNSSGIEIKGPSIDTYESINGFSPDVGHLSFGEANALYYKTVTVCNQRTFVGHVNYYTPVGGSQTKLMPDRILYSPIGKYDTFPPNQFIDIGINDGEDFTVLESFGTKLLAFKQSTLYIIDVTSPNDTEWFLESTHNGLGVDKPSAVVKTEFGICWARKTGIYAWSPSQGIVELSSKLDKNSSPMTGLTDPVVGYYPPDSHLVIIANCGAASNGLVYDFVTKSFAEIGLGTSGDRYTAAAMSNFQNNQDELIWLESNDVKKYNPTQGASSFKFETKDFDFGNPGVLKRPKKIIFSYATGTGADGVEVRTSVYKDGSTTATVLQEDTVWGTAASASPPSTRGGTHVVDASSLGTISSMKIRVDAYNSDGTATTDGNYRINDITIVYRTTRKEPSTAVNS